MLTIADLFDKVTKPAHTEQRLRIAYINVFTGRGNSAAEDKELVMTDLALTSGFFAVSDASATDSELRFAEGQRALFGRIVRMTNPTPKEADAILKAMARETAAAENPTGDL